MALRFTVLASGSAGNASLLEADGFGLLLDVGLGPRQLASRMAAVGASWQGVHAVLLTHTHSDHWNERTLAHLRRQQIPLYCHAGHHEVLQTGGVEFDKLQTAALIRPYQVDQEWALTPGLRCRPLPLRHDGGATFGFRFSVLGATAEHPWSLAYLADLGSWTTELAQALADVDLLALEFNHDVDLEYASGRSPWLIARVLGEEGHLSNDQAAALLAEVLRLSAPGRMRHVIQLHLSRDCNKPDLAADSARAILNGNADTIQLHTARQDRAGPMLSLGAAVEQPTASSPAIPRRRKPVKAPWPVPTNQSFLPGWES